MLKRNGMYIRRIVLQSESDVAGSIPRAAKILACLSRNVNTVSDIAAQSRLAKSTVHRVLKLLEASYIVTEDPVNRRYYIGPLIAQLTINPLRVHEYMVRCAEEEMRRLANISEETITLDILIGMHIIHLYEIVSKHEVRITDINLRTGTPFTGATGKIMLSQLSDTVLDSYLKTIHIPKLTTRTITDNQTLLEQVKEIRQNGCTYSLGERIPGALCISAPVLNYTSPLGISIVGPETRLKPKLQAVINEIKISSLRISRKVLDIYALKNK